MRLNLQIEYADGGSATVKAIVADFINWERSTGRKSSQFQDGVGMEDLAFLAWSAVKRTGGTDKSFEAWYENLADLEAVEDVPKATQGEASSDS